MKTINHFILPDVQVRPGQDWAFLSHIGEYILDQRPDVIVCLGDFFDMHSLSSYDKGKKSGEGARVSEDIQAGKDAMATLLLPLLELQQRQRKNKEKVYKPKLVYTLGNHEQRIERYVNDNPELGEFLSYKNLGLEQFGWEVHDFLKPTEIDGITYTHYLANPMTGRPYSGSALNQLKTIGKSYVVGHKQVLDIGIRPIIDGSMQLGIICGACYPHDEAYKGYQGNNHFRGVIVLHDVRNGFADPMFVSLDYLNRRYG